MAVCQRASSILGFLLISDFILYTVSVIALVLGDCKFRSVKQNSAGCKIPPNSGFRGLDKC
jgi:hypothetical protein